MKTDRELLELAAKAAGHNLVIADIPHRTSMYGRETVFRIDGHPCKNWNPLTNDGDALWLAAKLKIDIEWQATNPFPEPRVEAYQRNDKGSYFCADEPEENYRRAIVRAAAEVGKGMLSQDEFMLMFPGRVDDEAVDRARAAVEASKP